MNDFLKKLKKAVRIVLYRPAINQSNCKKTGSYQLPFNNNGLLTRCEGHTEKNKTAVFVQPELASMTRANLVNKPFII